MKKKLIAAGAASLAVAAMPIVGVFADTTQQVDTLEITIQGACSFGYTNQVGSIDVTGVAHATGSGTITGTWSDAGDTIPGTDPAETYAHDTLSATMATGTVSNSLGTTTLGVYCNDEDGYTITAENAGALTADGVVGNIPINNAFSATSTGWSYQVAAGSAQTQRGEVKNGHTAWAKATGTTGTDSPIANEVIAGSKSTGSKTTSNAGDFFTITYGAGIDQSVAAGTYTGDITYTLAAVD